MAGQAWRSYRLLVQLTAQRRLQGHILRLQPRVFLFTAPAGEGVSIQHFFACRLLQLQEDARTGQEFADPSRGDYELDRATIDKLPAVDLKPDVLKEFIVANEEALLSM